MGLLFALYASTRRNIFAHDKSCTIQETASGSDKKHLYGS